MRAELFPRLIAVAAALILAGPPLAAAPVAAQARLFAEPAFQRLWERYDRPVELGLTARSWTWGPNSPFNGYEPYEQGRGGRRLVQYFDKTRMELTNPTADRDGPAVVTTGLLVRELVAGRIALGDQPEQVEPREPAAEAVAGDPAAGGNDEAPTYASFRRVASLANDRPADNRVGQPVTETLDRFGRVGRLPDDQAGLAAAVRLAVFDATLRHNIPDRFWAFLNQQGTIYEDGRLTSNATVYQPWAYVMGVPITEPYWARARVGGGERWVLIQLYERRALTYTPTNPPGFEVELGNVGQHYYRWRYQPTDAQPGAERPTITRLERTALTATSARIEWLTTVPTTSQLWYGTTPAYQWVVGSAELVTQHAVDLTGLTPNTTYHYRTLARDRVGRIADDADHTFTTPAQAP